ncbi:ABC-2 transporter permease [Lacrimispora saccharolytica]|uniref:ABC-2 transporter permease n=1 Tax=Lacrimispora saccharolytica TaxID=84030 RepID=UPI00265C90F5|nr:ABC-2 transporter permease [Lacrimispora saccharolytica]MCF2657347.1 ABC-2 transporter permease [Lacrimispora saccharolytica]
MKALFIKDIRIVLKQQRILICAFFAVITILAFATDNSMYAVAFVLFLVPTMMLTTISYDTFENGMSYIMSLPVSVKDYVTEKYILTVASSLIFNIMATILINVVLSIGKGVGIMPLELIVNAMLAQFMVLIYISLVLPVDIRFGTDKGMIIVVLMAVVIGAAGPMLGNINVDSGLMYKLSEAEITSVPVNTALLLMSVGGIFAIVSYFVSVKLMKQMEY